MGTVEEERRRGDAGRSGLCAHQETGGLAAGVGGLENVRKRVPRLVRPRTAGSRRLTGVARSQGHSFGHLRLIGRLTALWGRTLLGLPMDRRRGWSAQSVRQAA